ncbi:MAG: 2-keto-3-deoxygluconate kinase, partial [candidate division NC10 bacterium]|nr:2-keto-3-deoxygluconate kinase [candidate division NC10 bacterium]
VWPTGAEANAAVTLARLGKQVGWISKLPDHPLSRLIVAAVSRHGVDTSRVVWTPEGRVGTLFYERAVPPRPPRVWYDRKDSAFTTLAASDLDWEYLTAAQIVLMAGTAPALSPVLRETTREIATRVRSAGRLFALDVNYRAKLWPPQEAADYLATLLPLVSILFCGQRDAARLFGFAGDPESVARRLQERFGIPAVVLTLGSDGALAISDRVHRAPRVRQVTVVDPVGAGDALAGGFLCGYLEGGVQRGLEIGSAVGALHCTIPGDFAYITRAEVEEFLASDDEDIQR